VKDLEQIGREVGRLARVPAVDPLVAAARRVWPQAVGDEVARNSLPVRRSGDALVVFCASATWASELTLLERTARLRLGELLGEDPPPLRFEVGNVDDPSRERPQAPPSRPLHPPSKQQLAQARELAADVADPVLRATVERAIAAALAREE
jgi:Dna[CI] antecedent, DciA